MATINFLYRSTKSKANLHLRLLYRFNEKDYVFGVNTKFEVSKDYWFENHVPDKKTKKIKGTKDIEIINERNRVENELNKIENHILNAFNSVNPDEITKEWLQTQINYYYNPPQQPESLPSELIKFFDVFIEYRGNEITESTIKKYTTVKNMLTKYEDSIKKPLLIININLEFKKNFENYCIKNLYAPNTISKSFQIIKTVCRKARELNLETSRQLDSIKTPYKETDTLYLTPKEIQAIEDLKDLPEYLDNARDWLLISIYTAQRISDFMKFNKDMIRWIKDEGGVLKPLIDFGIHKLKYKNKKATIPLSSKVMQLLLKRNGDFPRAIADQNYNDYIKLVCKEAKINELVKGQLMKETASKSKIYRKKEGYYPKWELISSHVGRRSFVSNNIGKIPTTSVIAFTHHQTEQLLRNYLGTGNDEKAMEAHRYTE